MYSVFCCYLLVFADGISEARDEVKSEYNLPSVLIWSDRCWLTRDRSAGFKKQSAVKKMPNMMLTALVMMKSCDADDTCADDD